MSLHPNEVLLAPVVSEKSYSLIEDRKYSFRVHPDAHKTQIRQAVEELFEVKVQSVNVIQVRSKPKRRGMVRGRKPGWKKAIVQLREGESIEIFEGAQFSGPPGTLLRLALSRCARRRPQRGLLPNAPCVLAWLGASDPGIQQCHLEDH